MQVRGGAETYYWINQYSRAGISPKPRNELSCWHFLAPWLLNVVMNYSSCLEFSSSHEKSCNRHVIPFSHELFNIDCSRADKHVNNINVCLHQTYHFFLSHWLFVEGANSMLTFESAYKKVIAALLYCEKRTIPCQRTSRILLFVGFSSYYVYRSKINTTIDKTLSFFIQCKASTSV